MTEFEQAMKQNILDIEATIGEHLSRGVTPEIFVARNQMIDMILEYLKVTPNWTDPEGVIIAFADGTIPLKVCRSIDVPFGQIYIR